MKPSASDAEIGQAVSCRASATPLGHLGHIPVAAFTLNHGGHITSWTTVATTLFGRTAQEALGQLWQSLVPERQAHVRLTEASQSVAQGESYRGVLPLRTAEGKPYQVLLDCSALIDAQGQIGLLCQVSDVERTRRAETEMAFVNALMQVSPFGLGMIDNDLRYVLVNDALAAFNGLPRAEHIGRQVASVLLDEDDGEYEKAMRSVMETGTPLHALVADRRTEGAPDRGSWSVSLFRVTNGHDQVLGLGGMVVDVTEKETAIFEASTVRERLALVNEASARIGTTLEMDTTARELTEVAVPAFADVATVELRTGLFEDGDYPPVDRPVSTRRVASNSTLDSAASQVLFSAPAEMVHPVGSRSHSALCTGLAWHMEMFDEAAIVDWAHDEEGAQLLRKSGLGSLIMVPLIARGRCLGIAKFGRSTQQEPMTIDDLKIAEELATRAAVCLDNAWMYFKERRIAVALQRNMLPGENDIPQRSGLDVAYHYRPSSRDAQVGGDWFDVIPLSGHRIALVIGDMMGHDIHAAANMGKLRTAMRTLARLDLEPVDLLTRLDDVVQDSAAIDYATCVYAVYDTVTRQCSIACAGHPAPVLRHPDGTTELVRVAPGVPLGVGVGDPEFAATDLVLPENGTLVLYTDGLIERRDEDIDAGIEALRHALARPARSLQDLCNDMVAEMRRRTEDDDLAVLMAHAPSTPDHRAIRWAIKSCVSSVPRARKLVREALGTWGLPDLLDLTELLVSELVTNAVRHARGDIELRLAKGTTLVCEVADGDERMPRRTHADVSDERGRGLTLVSELAQVWGTRPTARGKVVWFEIPLPHRMDPTATN